MPLPSAAFTVLAPLALLLVAAGWFDVRERRIPNSLVTTGTVFAFTAHGLLPESAGFLSGGIGLTSAIAGLLLGAAALFPLYAVGAMGAGDVKLLAMLGAFLGPQHILGAVLFSLVSGSLISLAVIAARRRFGGNLPFGIAIACGTLGYIGLLWSRHTSGGPA